MKKVYTFLLVSVVLFVVVPQQSHGQSDYYITGANQTQLHVQEFGEGDPVILLAGGPFLNPIYMEDVWEELDSQFRWVVFHQRGTGNSLIENPDSSSFALANYVNDLEVLRNELQVDQLTLVGHSWGGMLAMEYAAQHPGKVEKMVLLGTGGPTSNFLRYFNDNINMRLHDTDRAEMAKLKKQNKNTLPGYFPGYFYSRDRAIQIKEKADFEKWYGQTQFRSIVNKSYIANTKERVNQLKNYASPIHLIQGRQDPIGESTAYEIKEIIPQTQITFIEKAGHMPWLESEKQEDKFFNLLSKSLAN